MTVSSESDIDAFLLEHCERFSASELSGLVLARFHVELTKDQINHRLRKLRDGEPRSLDQAIKNNVKMARSIIRLRHSILADEELAEVLPRIRQRLEVQAATGRVVGLSYDELREIIFGDR